MGGNYFTSENAWRHLYFITGQTSDEFYTDGGLKVDIEQLTYLELKKSGYKRIIFYDKDIKLYCYDDDSYALLSVHGNTLDQRRRLETENQVATSPRNRGLRRGKHAHNISATGNDGEDDYKNDNSVRAYDEALDQEWILGENSNILIRNYGRSRLHLGMRNTTFVKRQIDAYMYDAKIKTAIVINDPTSFLREFGDEPMHSFTAKYERLGTNNKNIMVFLYTDKRLGNIYQVNQFEGEGKDANAINIGCPNAAELRNMLMYLKINHGLKIRMRELSDVALSLKQAMSLSLQNPGTKEVYARLENYGTEKYLSSDDCYRLLEVEKPAAAREQLEQLIGMKTVKDALAEYYTDNKSKTSVYDYLTASRLQPDLKNPNQPKEMIHFVLTGNPGTGKTTVAKLIGQIFFEMGILSNGRTTKVTRTDLVAGYVGQTAIKTQACIDRAMGGVLFIEEAYSLKRTDSSENDFGQEAIDTLLEQLSDRSGDFVVIAAGYPREMEHFLSSNPGLASRFRKLHIEDYTAEEMQKILLYQANKRKAVFSGELSEKLSDFCENWVNLSGENWANGREAENLVNSMLRSWKSDSGKETKILSDGVEYTVLDIKHIPEDLKDNLRPVSEMRAETLNRLNRMTGLSEVKATVEKLRRRMISGDMKEPGHYLFIGNPGTGKTTVARYMGQILRNLGMLKRGHLVEFTASSLMSTVFNDSNHGNFYEVAKKAFDGVLFIDEAYQLVSDTTGRGGSILDALLPFMEKYRKNICVIVAGYEDEMDDFLMHNSGFKSRFTDTIYFDNYSGAELCEILLSMLAEKGITADDEYKEYALRALTRYVLIHGHDKTFGNARYIRGVFLPDSLDAQTNRLINTYGEDFPRELKSIITGDDIPENLIRFTKTPLEKKDDRSAIEKIDSLIGYELIKKELHKLLKTAEFNKTNDVGAIAMTERLHWVLEGNPGTGKTTIAKLIGQVYKECGILSNGRTLKVTRSDLVAGYEGQTAIKTRRCIQKAMGGVLFIDEAYSLTKVENGDGGFGQEAIAELVEAMDTLNGEFAVICAGYPEDMEDFLKANAGLASRMKKFVLEDYTADELAKIFQQKCNQEKIIIDEPLLSKMEVFFANKKRVEEKSSDWGNGREVENLLREMLHNWMDDPVYSTDAEQMMRRKLTENHIPEKQKRFLKGKKLSEKKESTALEDINNLIGFEDVKSKLRDLLALKDTAIKYGRDDLLDDVNLHWVLRGNPGTGKTTVAKLIGKVYKEMGLLSNGKTYKVTRSDLVAGYVGQTAIKTQKCIDNAMGGVLFIDEAYTLKRSDSVGNDFGQEAIDTLLEQMSYRNGEFAVIAAGYPREMDVFLDSNPGFESRFEDNILLKDYTADELLQIFKMKCRNKKFYIDENTEAVILKLFQNMLAANIKNWANGREAENLEKKMRKMWARNPITHINESSGEMLSYYTSDHIPDRYREYLTENNLEESISLSKEESQNGNTEKNSFMIPENKLAVHKKTYVFEEEYLDQAKGVVIIYADTPDGLSSGSGAIISSDGIIFTCLHVIAGSTDIHVRLINEDHGIKWEKAEIVWEKSEMDVALLKIPDGDYTSLPMRSLETDTKTGESIYHWGYPFGESLSDDIDSLQPSLFQGYISSIQTKNGLKRINTNMEAKRGCSGGPVFSKRDGCIIGIFCGSLRMGNDEIVEELNYVLPIKYLWENVVVSDSDE